MGTGRFNKLAQELTAEFQPGSKARRQIDAIIKVAGDHPKGWDLKKLQRAAGELRARQRRQQERQETR